MVAGKKGKIVAETVRGTSTLQSTTSTHAETRRRGNSKGIDEIIGQTVDIELNFVETLAPAHPKQVLTYLRLLNLPVGLLIYSALQR